jgi:hypothetical protein
VFASCCAPKPCSSSRCFMYPFPCPAAVTPAPLSTTNSAVGPSGCCRKNSWQHTVIQRRKPCAHAEVQLADGEALQFTMMVCSERHQIATGCPVQPFGSTGEGTPNRHMKSKRNSIESLQAPRHTSAALHVQVLARRAWALRHHPHQMGWSSGTPGSASRTQQTVRFTHHAKAMTIPEVLAMPR